MAIKENDLRTKTAFGDSGVFDNPNRGYLKSYFIQPDFIAKVIGFRATSMDFLSQLAELHVKSPVISLDKSSHLVNSLFKSLLTSPDNLSRRSSSHFTAREKSSHPSILLFTALGKSLVTSLHSTRDINLLSPLTLPLTSHLSFHLTSQVNLTTFLKNFVVDERPTTSLTSWTTTHADNNRAKILVLVFVLGSKAL